jgi:hypothetical protein
VTNNGAKTKPAPQGRPSALPVAPARLQALSSAARQPLEAGSESARELTASPPTRDRASGGVVADRLAGLETLDLSAMRREWRRLYRAEPPRLSRDLMRRALAYRIQEIAFGGLSKATLRRLAGLAAEFESDGRIATQSRPRIKAGARLVREWHGRTHSVIATEEGFQFEGKVYRSLTSIAREITGAGWSGPRFFGLARTVNASEGTDAPLGKVNIHDWGGGDPSQCVVASDA